MMLKAVVHLMMIRMMNDSGGDCRRGDSGGDAVIMALMTIFFNFF